MAIPMGIGRLGFDNTVFKRKFRYTFELFNICGAQRVERWYVKLASRPNLSIEETEINFLNAKTWIPGKAAWESITVTYIDVANTFDLQPLYNWLAAVYDFSDPIQLNQGSRRADYTAQAVIRTVDGCGQELEEWVLNDVWPTGVNFGDLDYASSDEVTIELTLRYSDVSYRHLCPTFIPQGCCTPCTGSGAAAIGTLVV